MTCAFCAEEVPDGAERCPSCGERLVEAEAQSPPRSTAGPIVALAAVGVVCLLCLAFLALVVSRPRTGPVKPARTKSHINAMKAALAMYEFDMGHYPRLAPRVAGAGLLEDDPVALQRALLAPPGQGGGPNAPYLQDWPASLLSQGQQPLLLDPWGNPYHYREWASVRAADKDGLSARRSAGRGTILDTPHEPNGFEVWSDGPNGINEYGDPASDDVVSWR